MAIGNQLGRGYQLGRGSRPTRTYTNCNSRDSASPSWSRSIRVLQFGRGFHLVPPLSCFAFQSSSVFLNKKLPFWKGVPCLEGVLGRPAPTNCNSRGSASPSWLRILSAFGCEFMSIRQPALFSLSNRVSHRSFLVSHPRSFMFRRFQSKNV